MEKSLGAIVIGSGVLAANYIESSRDALTRFAYDSRLDFLADDVFVRNVGCAVVLGGLVGLAVSAYRSKNCKE